MTKSNFLEDFKRMTHDAWLKGWHERNGGNISYRLTELDVQWIYSELSFFSEWISLPMEVTNLANEYFLITGSGKFIRNISIDVQANSGIIRLNHLGKSLR